MPWRSNEKAKLHMRARYELRKAAGLCPRCGIVPDRDGIFCAGCIRMQARRRDKSDHVDELMARLNEVGGGRI